MVWSRTAHDGVPRVKRHVKASHASATPATDGRYVVAMLGSEGLHAFDMSGTPLWRKDLGVLAVGLADDPSYEWGPASSPVIHGDLVIVQNDRDTVLSAYRVESGERVYQQRLARDSGSFSASPVAADGRLYFTSEDGHVYVVRAGPKYALIATNDMGEVCMATPAISGDFLIMRTRTRIVALRNPS